MELSIVLRKRRALINGGTITATSRRATNIVPILRAVALIAPGETYAATAFDRRSESLLER
jgi:hypothetical protein